MWKPDASRAEDVRRSMAAATTALAKSFEPGVVRRALEAAGTLALLDAARDVAPLDEPLRTQIRTELGKVSFAELRDRGDDLASHAERIGSSDDEPARRAIVEALEGRTSVELLRRGAIVLTGQPVPWTAAQVAQLRAFDDALEASLYRLVALNDARSAALSWIAPRHRRELWWLSRGVDIPQDTVARLRDVAALVAVSAPARALFADLVDAEERRAAAQSRGSTRRILRRPRTFQAFVDAFARRAVSGGPDRDELVQIFDDASTVVSFARPDRLVIVVREPLRDSEAPHVRVDDERLEAVSAGKNEWHVQLQARARAATALGVVVPLTSGTRVIDLVEALSSR